MKSLKLLPAKVFLLSVLIIFSACKGGNSINPPKTGNTPVIGSVAAILVASAAVAVVMKKKNED